MKNTERQTSQATVALTTSAATSPEIDLSHHASGEVFIPTGSPITSLTYHVSQTMGGTYIAAYDATPAAIVQTVAAARAYPIPTQLFGAGAMRIVVNSAGSVGINLKS